MVREKKTTNKKPGGKYTGEKREFGKRPESPREPFKKSSTARPAKVERAVVDDKRNVFEDIPRLEGRNPVIEALKSGRTIEKIYIAKGSSEGSIRQAISMAREKGIVINEVDRVKLDSMSETRSHQGIIAIVTPYSYVEVDEILNYAKQKNEPPFVIVLDEIYDPNNLGSIIRTADASGAHGVIISKRRAVGLTPTVAKASAGAVEYVKVAKVTNITQTIKVLKEQGLWIVGTDMDGDKQYFEADLAGPIAVVIGSEGEGMGKLIKENCDFVVRLPMRGKISSLNAGVAGAIVMYEITRQRLLKG